jgi:hypothetical protein
MSEFTFHHRERAAIFEAARKAEPGASRDRELLLIATLAATVVVSLYPPADVMQ